MPKLTYFEVLKEDTETVLFDVIIDGKKFNCSADTYKNKEMFTPFEISSGKSLHGFWWYSGLRIEYTIKRLYSSGTKFWSDIKI